MTEPLTLTDQQLERLADMIADRLAARTAPTRSAAEVMLSVNQLASRLGVTPSYVYNHAVELGGVKLSDSPKAPWRFNPETARERVTAHAERPDVASKPPLKPRSRGRRAPSDDVDLLPIRGSKPPFYTGT